jgi:hypothetical protein
MFGPDLRAEGRFLPATPVHGLSPTTPSKSSYLYFLFIFKYPLNYSSSYFISSSTITSIQLLFTL